MQNDSLKCNRLQFTHVYL